MTQEQFNILQTYFGCELKSTTQTLKDWFSEMTIPGPTMITYKGIDIGSIDLKYEEIFDRIKLIKKNYNDICIFPDGWKIIKDED